MTEQEFQKLMKGMEEWEPPKLTEEELEEERETAARMKAAVVINVSKLMIRLQNILHKDEKEMIMELQNQVLMEEAGIVKLKTIEASLQLLANSLVQ
jgi:hypothetical protein